MVPALAILVGGLAAVAAPPPIRAADRRSPSDRATDRGVEALGRPGAAPPGGGAGMIEFDQVSVTYDEAPAPVLRHVDLQIDEGELALVVGRTGVGKSTLLGAINGLVPHFTGGTLAGRVVVDGRDTRPTSPGSWPTSWAWSARTRWPAS